MSSNLSRFRRKAAPPAQSQGAMPGAWHAAQETYALVTLNYKSVAKIGAVPLLIVGTLQAIYAIYPTLLNLLLTVCGNMAATGMFAVGLQRMVAGSVQHQLYRFRFTDKNWRIAAVVMLAMIPVVLLSLGILALGYVLAQNLMAPSVLGILLLCGIVMGLALAAYTAVRFSVIMPAIALDEPIDLHSAVRATRGRAWQLWRGLLATLSPILILSAALAFYAVRTGSASWAASSLQGFTVITAVPLSVVFLTLSYFRYVRREAKPKMKIIGEPAWHVRVWYEVQRMIGFGWRLMMLLAEQFQPKLKPSAHVKVMPGKKSPSRAAPQNWPPKSTMSPGTSGRRAPRFETRPVAPAAAAEASSGRTGKEDLARKVAEKLADLEEDKLVQLAALLDKNAAAKSPISAPPKPIKAAAKPAATAAIPPVRRLRTAERSADGKKLNEMLAANENSDKGGEIRN